MQEYKVALDPEGGPITRLALAMYVKDVYELFFKAAACAPLLVSSRPMASLRGSAHCMCVSGTDGAERRERRVEGHDHTAPRCVHGTSVVGVAPGDGARGRVRRLRPKSRPSGLFALVDRDELCMHVRNQEEGLR